MKRRAFFAVPGTLALAGCAAFRARLGSPLLGAREWSSYDGKVMPWTAWLPSHGRSPRAVVITVHGLSGAASDFGLLGQALPRQGFAVYGYELRGQGHDPKEHERGDIISAKQWMRDLETFHRLVRERHPGRPVFWYGESMGTLIALHTAAWRLGAAADPDGIILASPIAGLRAAVSDTRKWLLRTAASLTPRQRYTLGELSGTDESNIRVTATSTHGARMARTPHHVHDFTLRLLGELGRMMDEAPHAADHVRLPVLFLASPNDVVTSPDQVQTLFSSVRSTDKTLHWYTRSYHLLLHDVQRADVVDDVIEWLDRRATSKRRSSQ